MINNRSVSLGNSFYFLYSIDVSLRTRIIHGPFCESFAALSAGSLVLNKHLYQGMCSKQGPTLRELYKHISQALYQTLKTTKVNFEKLSLTSFQIRLIPKQNTEKPFQYYDFFKIHRKIRNTVQVPENTKHLRVKCKSNSRFYVLISS